MIATTSDNKRNTSIIRISQQAIEQLIVLMKQEGLDSKEDFIRCDITQGGCKGLSYDLSFEKKNPQGEDFYRKEGVDIYEYEGIRILIDKKSKLYLAGASLEYSGGLNGNGFYFTNPNASSTCGCGESFVF